jgi:hypothetical protein
MNHFDEHILELYVLNSPKVNDRREEISAHLKECAGCRLLVEEIASFHGELSEEMKHRAVESEAESTALIKKHSDVVPYERWVSLPPPDNTALQKFRRFVYHHPFATTIGSFGLAAVLFAVINVAITKKDTNPAYVHYNTKTDFIEVYNKNDEELWQLPSISLEGNWKDEREFNTKQTVVTDLDGDGANEVVSTVLLNAETPDRIGVLRVYDPKKRLLWMKQFVESFSYLNRQYSPYFTATVLNIADFLGNGKKEIIVSVGNTDRSPFIISRFDANGKELGQYWHFGHIGHTYEAMLSQNKKRVIIACGTNDTPDTVRDEFPVVAVLDPTKIVGEKKSTASQGFDLPYSDAELLYIRFPESDMNESLLISSFVEFMVRENEQTLQFNVRANLPSGGEFRFHYFFSIEDMRILYVKSNSNTDRLHDHLVQEGKLKGKLDQSYLENLKNGVRYWDGKEWRKEVTIVQYLLP